MRSNKQLEKCEDRVEIYVQFSVKYYTSGKVERSICGIPFQISSRQSKRKRFTIFSNLRSFGLHTMRSNLADCIIRIDFPAVRARSRLLYVFILCPGTLRYVPCPGRRFTPS